MLTTPAVLPALEASTYVMTLYAGNFLARHSLFTFVHASKVLVHLAGGGLFARRL